MLVPFALVAGEEAYLERKFGDVYRGYRSPYGGWI
jgi:protein-S-isoprenylcysteine O-methyltransferase Ste14